MFDSRDTYFVCKGMYLPLPDEEEKKKIQGQTLHFHLRELIYFINSLTCVKTAESSLRTKRCSGGGGNGEGGKV